MATRHGPGWYKKLVSGKVDHIRDQVANQYICHMDKASDGRYALHISCSLQPARLLQEFLLGFAKFPPRSCTHARLLRPRVSLKGNMLLKDLYQELIMSRGLLTLAYIKAQKGVYMCYSCITLGVGYFCYYTTVRGEVEEEC